MRATRRICGGRSRAQRSALRQQVPSRKRGVDRIVTLDDTGHTYNLVESVYTCFDETVLIDTPVGPSTTTTSRLSARIRGGCPPCPDTHVLCSDPGGPHDETEEAPLASSQMRNLRFRTSAVCLLRGLTRGPCVAFGDAPISFPGLRREPPSLLTDPRFMRACPPIRGEAWQATSPSGCASPSARLRSRRVWLPHGGGEARCSNISKNPRGCWTERGAEWSSPPRPRLESRHSTGTGQCGTNES